jgi:hypothetical protein
MIEKETKHTVILAIDAATMARSKADLNLALRLRQAIIDLSLDGHRPKQIEKKSPEGLVEGIIFVKEIIR